jgi:RNA polymerase sigma-70 factor (ECF subfamily)
MVQFEAFLRPQLESAYRLAYRLTGGAADAEDLVQEASLLAWRGFGSFEPGSNFPAWFYRILTNAFVSRYRRSRRQGLAVALDEVPELYLWRKCAAAGREDVLADPGETLVARLDAERINAAIIALPEEYRVVAALYFVEELSYQEIAEMVSIPIGTVRSRLFRARRRLQAALWDAALALGLVTEPEGLP